MSIAKSVCENYLFENYPLKSGIATGILDLLSTGSYPRPDILNASKIGNGLANNLVGRSKTSEGF